MNRLTSPGWRALLLGTLAVLIVPAIPTALRSFLPFTETPVLLAASLAVCAALGWWNGGGRVLAFVATLLALLALLTGVSLTGGAYPSLVLGWALLLAGSFGVASLLTPGEGFFTRAISAIGIALAASLVVAVVSPANFISLRATMGSEYEQRTDATIIAVDSAFDMPVWRTMKDRNPEFAARLAQNEAELRSIPQTALGITPALIGLESLGLLALAWALYHRFARTRLGPEMGALRDFKFNDQLIWGLAVGATIYFLPVFADGKTAGLNLLVFFGTLFLLRGAGVLAFISRGRWIGALIVVLTLFPLVRDVAFALALGVGVGDTWMDWRSRIQPTG